MAETTDKKKDTKEDKHANNKIEDYLTGPRKKRKNYVIFALSDHFEKDLAAAMDHYVKRSYPHLATSSPGSAEELSRQFGRNISLLVIDDEFDEPEMVMALVRALKQKRRNELIPVLFMTRNATDLVDRYHRELLAYHEADEYVVYPGLPRNKIYSRLKIGIDEQNKRRSRRYTIQIPIRFFHLTRDQWIDGNLIDLSMHGALISAKRDIIFQGGDQLKLHIPISDHLSHAHGDFIKISGRVRRVYIAGTKVALSFEHVTDKQHHQLGLLLSSLVTRQLQRNSMRLKAQMNAQGQDNN